MKVAVINPPWPGEGYGVRSNSRWPHRRGDKMLPFPIYLAYTSAILKKEGFQVCTIDSVEKEIGIYTLAKILEKENPKAVILEISAPSLNYDLETAAKIKEKLPETFIALCGSHATYDHKQLTKNHNFIDACIRGEFDYTAKELCKAIRDKKNLKEVEGITYQDKGKTIINPDRPLIGDLDELPFPDREGLNPYYPQAFYEGKRTFLMITSRGCPYRCTFCVWPQTMYGRKFRTRSTKNILDEIEGLVNKYDADEICFDDDTFAVSKEKIKEFCQEKIARNIKIPWTCMGRVDTIDYETARLMKKAGCTQIFFGFESGSEKILQNIKKGITKEGMIKAVRATQKAGLVASGSFMFGTPEEDPKTAQETIDFAKKLKADYVQFTLASPFPGSEFFYEAEKEGLLEIDSLEDLDGHKGPIARTKHLTREDLAGIRRKANIAYYTSPGVILQSLKKAKSTKDIRRIARGAKSVLNRILFYKK